MIWWSFFQISIWFPGFRIPGFRVSRFWFLIFFGFLWLLRIFLKSSNLNVFDHISWPVYFSNMMLGFFFTKSCYNLPCFGIFPFSPDFIQIFRFPQFWSDFFRDLMINISNLSSLFLISYIFSTLIFLMIYFSKILWYTSWMWYEIFSGFFF